ncbi:hypothetical protein [Kordiimonas gwangyangensis]|uniref:hypothetical protein n=1 Tax=Kordiimonas gwangyangensis TaxID=288022 RepID=UPI0012DEAAEE|nr:hypothetical protein [Kordiimonas gwangyangensis]
MGVVRRYRPARKPSGAVALFDTEEDMQAAVDDLESHGFSNAAISRPVAPSEVASAIKQPVFSVADLEDDARVPREPVDDNNSRTAITMVCVLTPIYLLMLAGAAFAAGHGMQTWQAIVVIVGLGAIGMIGAGYFVSRIVSERRSRIRAEKALGGLLLWVRTGSREQEGRALEILRRHAGRDVHLHGPALQH